MLLTKIEPGAGSVVESAGRERDFVPFSCVLDILFLILVGADRLLVDNSFAAYLQRCGSLGHQDLLWLISAADGAVVRRYIPTGN